LHRGKQSIKQFYATDDEFTHFHYHLKFLPCPHCRRIGFLILHGFLTGYGQVSLVERGRRIYCSNRKNRPGCGRTFSLLKGGCIKNFMVFGKWLAVFLEQLSRGLNIALAARKAGLAMSRTSIYRLFHTFRRNQSHIRTFLIQIKGPPPALQTNNPVIQTILHLKSIFTDCIVTQFQHRFQTPIFP